MHLLIDAGNSSIKWNLYDAGNKQFLRPPQAFLWRSDDLSALLHAQWGGLKSIKSVLLANVAGQTVEQAIQQWATTNHQQARIITTQSNAFGVRNAYKNPEQLGVDRWLAVLAAVTLRPEQNLCIVSSGTAITVDTVTDQGHHRGGLIVPGPQLMKKALLQHTHGVKIEQDTAELSPFTDSTSAAVNHGVLLAAVGFIDRAIADIETELGNTVTKLITGGDAQTISAHSHHIFISEPELVLKGLALYADDNQ
jgi:type III pantothenate kinase